MEKTVDEATNSTPDISSLLAKGDGPEKTVENAAEQGVEKAVDEATNSTPDISSLLAKKAMDEDKAIEKRRFK